MPAAVVGGEQNQVIVTEQPLLGSLFKSQNGSTWTPSQYEDLKFELHRCKFVKNGDISLFNQNLPKDLEKLDPNALTMQSRKVKLNTTTITDTGLEGRIHNQTAEHWRQLVTS